jgi:hypothetical protein
MSTWLAGYSTPYGVEVIVAEPGRNRHRLAPWHVEGLLTLNETSLITSHRPQPLRRQSMSSSLIIVIVEPVEHVHSPAHYHLAEIPSYHNL